VEKAKNTEIFQALRCTDSGCAKGSAGSAISLELIGEEPLLIRIDDKPYSVVMRTPGDEVFHGAGFCLGEGIADCPEDFTSIGYCRDLDPNVIDIRLRPERREKIKDILERRGFVSQTSCGICGKEMIKDLYQMLEPADDAFEMEVTNIFECAKLLSKKQKYYPVTRGSHAALILDNNLDVICFAEDVGRHNALDKAVGKAFMTRKLEMARVLVMSSRISYELVQKAARAHLPVMISKSRPTALAANMGRSLNMTLACAFGESELIVVCGENRIKKAGS
jgi:FdhD protein